MKKRLKKKVLNKYGFKHYRDYKRVIGNPLKESIRDQKRWIKQGKPITQNEAEILINFGFYTESEIKNCFHIQKGEQTNAN